MTRFSTKSVYMVIVVVGFTLAIADHLFSPALSTMTSPSDDGQACAPCGAPCNPTDN